MLIRLGLARFSLMLTSLFASLFVGGCGPTVTAHTPNDAAQEQPSDLAEAPDLQFPGTRVRFVINQVFFPEQMGDFAIDLNGDTFPENQFTNLIRSPGLRDLNLQAAANLGVIRGDALELVSFTTTDERLLSDPVATATLYGATPQHAPDLSGAGQFSVDHTVAGGALRGPLVAGLFTSADPIRATSAPAATLRINLLGAPVDLPLVGVRITFTVTANGLMQGQINGALSKKNVTDALVAALGRGLNTLAQSHPCSSDCMQVLATFDASPKDGTITALEAGGTLASYLMSDVQLYDAMGRWFPSPANAMRDSLSFGVGFTAVKAGFDE